MKYDDRIDKSSLLLPPLPLSGPLESVVNSENGGPHCLVINKVIDSKLHEISNTLENDISASLTPLPGTQ